ncbi:DUF4115 domain-containing protein [Deinococcus sp. HMF7620]|uniref:DUF4115 domain-containing protein n=1 Tax=Deinococcus arboris TaxID=2682977 RepID=A0A7C9HR58_9DEIO|nr:RodZ domain-containing protein [Deinococcus arboris]MVN86732.1 DUF4115 domain-containing protein [Deinococcus arboris]
MGFGSALKQAREAQGRTVPELALATKIRGDYLRALEDGQFHLLPERPFVRSYLQRYARELGLDAAPLLADFDRQAPAINRPERPPLLAQRRPSPARRWALIGLAGAALLAGGVTAYLALRPAPTVTVTAPPQPAVQTSVLVRLTVSSVPSGARVYLDNRDLGPTPVRSFPVQARERAQLRVEYTGRAPLKEAVTLTRSRNLRATLASDSTGRSTLTDLSVPKPQATAQAAPPTAEAGESSTPTPTAAVTVTFSGASWTRVTDAQGRVVFEGIPAAGTVKGFASGVTIRTGNAAAVQVSVAGAKAAPMGQTGQVVTRRF